VPLVTQASLINLIIVSKQFDVFFPSVTGTILYTVMLAWSNQKEVKISTTLNNFSTNLVKTLEEFPSLKAIFMGVNLTQITHCSEKGRLPIITVKLIVVKRMQFYL
jgi:hypothetical protein